MKLIPNDITLEKVKNSDYWKLISIIVWNHYSEKKHQKDVKVTFEENYYGKSSGASSYNKDWNNPNYSEKGYTRTLNSVDIILTRSDYQCTIIIFAEDGNIMSLCTGKTRDQVHCRTLDVTNWLFENYLLTLKS